MKGGVTVAGLLKNLETRAHLLVLAPREYKTNSLLKRGCLKGRIWISLPSC